MARCRRAVALRGALAGGEDIYSSFLRPCGQRHRGDGPACRYWQWSPMPPTPPGEVIDRARRFNAVPGHVIEVAELIVFRSYLDPTKDRLGDLDLAVKFRDWLPDATPDERMKKRLAYSRASGRQFRL